MSAEVRSRLAWWFGGIAAGIVVLALAAAALVAWVVPTIAIREARRGVEAATGRTLAIGALDIHPFTWRVEVRDVSLSEVGGKGTFASFKRARASIGLSSFWKGGPVVYGVHLESPHFNLIRTAPNVFNFSDLLKYLEAPIPTLTLEDVAITGGSIDFEDRALARPERHTVTDAELLVPFLTTVPARATEFGTPRFHAVIDGAPLTIASRVRGLPTAVEASAEVDLKDLSLPVYLSYLPAELPVTVRSGKFAVKGTVGFRMSQEHGGELAWDGAATISGVGLRLKGEPVRLDLGGVTVRSRLTSGPKRGLVVEDAALEVRELAIPVHGADGLSIHAFTVDGVTFAGAKRQVEVASVLLDGMHVRLARDAKGRLDAQRVVDAVNRRLPRTRGSPTRPSEPVPFHIVRVEGKGIDLAITDGTRKEMPVLDLSGLQFVARDVTGPRMGKIPFELSARTGRDSTIRASGWVEPSPFAADVALDVENVDLARAGPYVNERADVVLAGGRLDVKLQATLAAKGRKTAGTVKGGVAVRELDVLDRGRGKLLAWKRLSVDGIDVALEPVRVAVAKVALEGLRANVVLARDGGSNLPGGKAKTAARDGKPDEKRAGTMAATAKPREEAATPTRIDELVVTDGALDVTDESVSGPFRAPVRDLQVRITGMSSEPGKEADVKVAMLLPKGAKLTVAGKGAPLKTPATADVHLVVDRLDLTVAQPYANTFLGLDVDRGSLALDTRVRLSPGTLAAENRIRVDQLTYGKAVKSDRATILPVRFLTDILRDREGNIVLDLPVSARTGEGDVAGKLVGQIVKDVLFPPGSPLRSIPFEACSESLGEDAQRRLRKLADALGERPAMKIVAVGYVDRAREAKACGERTAAEKAARAASPDATVPAAAKTAVTAAPMAAAAAPAAPPPVLEGDARMEAVAAARAEAVRAYLVGPGRLEPGRVAWRAATIGAPSTRGDETGARVEFAPQSDVQ